VCVTADERFEVSLLSTLGKVGCQDKRNVVTYVVLHVSLEWGRIRRRRMDSCQCRRKWEKVTHFADD